MASMQQVRFKSVRPQLMLAAPNAKDAIQFYQDAFGAEELFRLMYPKPRADGVKLVWYSEIVIAGTIINILDNPLASGNIDLKSLYCGASSCMLGLLTEDVEAAVNKAVKAGATVIQPIKVEKRYGNTTCSLLDPFGFFWVISSCTVKKTESDSAAGQIVA